MKTCFAFFMILIFFVSSGCVNEIPMETATIIVTNNGTYLIDMVRILINLNTDRTGENLLKASEYILFTPPDNFRSFTVMANTAYYVEVHFQGGEDSYRTQQTEILKKDQTVNLSFVYNL